MRHHHVECDLCGDVLDQESFQARNRDGRAVCVSCRERGLLPGQERELPRPLIPREPEEPELDET